MLRRARVCVRLRETDAATCARACVFLRSAITGAYTENVLKCRHVNEHAAQQLLLDTQMLRTTLLEVPGIAHGTPPPESYARFVRREMERIEALLKVLHVSVDRLMDSFRALMPSANDTDLVRIMDMKGIPKADQVALLDSFRQTVGGAVGASSVFSSIDARADARASTASAAASQGKSGGAPSGVTKLRSLFKIKDKSDKEGSVSSGSGGLAAFGGGEGREKSGEKEREKDITMPFRAIKDLFQRVADKAEKSGSDKGGKSGKP